MENASAAAASLSGPRRYRRVVGDDGGSARERVEPSNLTAMDIDGTSDGGSGGGGAPREDVAALFRRLESIGGSGALSADLQEMIVSSMLRDYDEGADSCARRGGAYCVDSLEISERDGPISAGVAFGERRAGPTGKIFVWSRFERWHPVEFCLRPFCIRRVMNSAASVSSGFCGICERKYAAFYVAGNLHTMLDVFLRSKPGKAHFEDDGVRVARAFNVPMESLGRYSTLIHEFPNQVRPVSEMTGLERVRGLREAFGLASPGVGLAMSSDARRREQARAYVAENAQRAQQQAQLRAQQQAVQQAEFARHQAAFEQQQAQLAQQLALQSLDENELPKAA